MHRVAAKRGKKNVCGEILIVSKGGEGSVRKLVRFPLLFLTGPGSWDFKTVEQLKGWSETQVSLRPVSGQRGTLNSLFVRHRSLFLAAAI